MAPWTIARQASLSRGFSKQEYWSGLPFPSPGDLPNPGIEPESPALQADALLLSNLGNPDVILIENKLNCYFVSNFILVFHGLIFFLIGIVMCSILLRF